MPTYAYACKTCGHRFDAVQAFSEPALTVCPECGGPLRKEYGSIGVTFNGSGFYRTDSRAGTSSGEKNGEKNGEKKTEPAGGGSGSSSSSSSSPSSSSSESKSAAAPAAS